MYRAGNLHASCARHDFLSCPVGALSNGSAIGLQQVGEPQPLLKHFVEHGRLDPGLPSHLGAMVLASGQRATRYKEAKVGTKSRLNLGLKYFLVFG